MKELGNGVANKWWEYSLPIEGKIGEKVEREKRNTFIFQKYKERKYVDGNNLLSLPLLHSALVESCGESDVVKVAKLFCENASLSLSSPFLPLPPSPNPPSPNPLLEEEEPLFFKILKEAKMNVATLELLIQSGGDVKMRDKHNNTPLHIVLILSTPSFSTLSQPFFLIFKKINNRRLGRIRGSTAG